jgi:xylulose-5-phosphate/fructose-6-phosphate phosphoketolase
MMLLNHTSRYHVAAAAVRGGAKHNPRVSTDATELAARFMHMVEKDHEYILKYGEGQIFCGFPHSDY